MERGFVFILLVLVMLSGLAVIYSKYSSRLVFIEVQEAEQELERLEIRWERLTLEERALSEHNRVEETARKKMEFIEPDRRAIIYIQL